MAKSFHAHRFVFAMCGVTLVELMVTIAVAAILLAVAVPGFRNLIVSNRLTATTNAFVAALNLARIEAVKRNARVTLCKTADPNATAPNCAASATWSQGAIVLCRPRHRRHSGERRHPVAGFAGPFPMAVTITACRQLCNCLRVSYLATGVSQGITAAGSTGLGNDTFTFCVSGQGRIINR
ncbi:GspH/FimT family pseudopilin [Hydrogenophilus thermoluteolus]|uniref:GspH/FimT family pseudopilin n=1 Tax=Hydrogenophilus thermoluteolus TaxID=297 RepID=UPI003F681DC7